MARKSNKTAQVETPAAESALEKVMGEHPCLCGFFEIERGDVPEGADPGDYLTFEGTGCSATTTRVFAPGHDAKLKSLLIKAGAEGASVRNEQGGVASVADAEHWAAKFDFGHMVVEGIRRATAKRAAKLALKEARAAARADKLTKRERTRKSSPIKGHDALEAFHEGALAQARQDQGLTREVTVKVGRWTYPATIDGASNAATFTSASGETKTVPAGKYTIVTK